VWTTDALLCHSIFFFFGVVLRFELRAFYLLGRWFYCLSHNYSPCYSTFILLIQVLNIFYLPFYFLIFHFFHHTGGWTEGLMFVGRHSTT
jgi:hypothetical protein